MIRFDSFSFSYQKRYPLYTNLNLTLEKGKIYGLFGKNGAGKSTLLKNITGLHSPSAGSVHVNNYTPGDRKPSFLSDIFLIPEDVYIPSISPKNFLRIYGKFYTKFSSSDFENYLRELEVPETSNLSKLSFGQRKKFIIAFALACNTSVILMDEPTNGLDIPSKSQFRKLLAKTISEERMFIISTHQVRDLDHILDHIIIVNNGALILSEDIFSISQKLAFKFYSSEPIEQNHLLSCEQILGGYAVMEKNIENEDTAINLEQLFNTAIIKSSEIQTLFQ